LGERVFAIGNPLRDYPYSVSEGIIGGLNRVLGSMTGKFGYLQSTATITWGNSGGPLVDMAGRVAGINTSIEIRHQGRQNYILPQINFALEGPLANRLVTDILTHNGRVRRAFLGLEITEYYSTKTSSTSQSPSPLLTGVLPNSPADRVLKEQVGQTIVAIDSVAMRNSEEILGVLEAIRPGTAMTLTLETPRGQRSDYRLTGDDLSRERLADVARYFFEKKGAGRASDDQGQVSVQWTLNPPTAQTSQATSDNTAVTVTHLVFNQELRRFVRSVINPPTTQSVTVVGAGIENNGFWRVGSLADLGLVIRLAARQGWIDLIPQESDGRSLVRFSIPARADTVARLLYY
jgi:hypothetical protein